MTEARLSASQRRALDLQKERLVIGAEAFLSESNVVEISRKKLGDSQLRNLLAIANETESPAVVINFIRYQIGRDHHANAWAKRGATGRTFGELLISAIDSGAVTQAVTDAGALEGVAEFSDVQRQIAKMYMLRHFLGFISRHLKYLEEQRRDRD